METKLVRGYLDFLKKENITIAVDDLSELLRHALCLALDLRSTGTESDVCVKLSEELRKIAKAEDLLDTSEVYRQGILEVCIHQIEMTRKKVLNVEMS